MHVSIDAMRLLLDSMILLLLAAVPAYGANAPAPNDFAGVSLGTSLKELKTRYPEASRNPDSDRHFQVYQVRALRGVGAKTAGAFSIYHGHVVGGQVILDNGNGLYWLSTMVTRYGKPDSCVYCTDPELVRAKWSWPNGTVLTIEDEMITELTKEGFQAREEWLKRGDNEITDNGDEDSDLATAGGSSKPRKKKHVPTAHSTVIVERQPPAAKPSGWDGYYDGAKSTLRRWLGYR